MVRRAVLLSGLRCGEKPSDDSRSYLSACSRADSATRFPRSLLRRTLSADLGRARRCAPRQAFQACLRCSFLARPTPARNRAPRDGLTESEWRREAAVRRALVHAESKPARAALPPQVPGPFCGGGGWGTLS